MMVTEEVYVALDVFIYSIIAFHYTQYLAPNPTFVFVKIDNIKSVIYAFAI